MTARTTLQGRCMVGVNRVVNSIVRAMKPKRFRGAPLLFLTTVGRTTGQTRTTPLIYLRDGDRWIVVASNGGSDWEPGWRLNLAAGSTGEISVDGERHQVVGRALEGREREAMWEQLNRDVFPYERYQRQVSRQIAVIALEPAVTPTLTQAVGR